MASGHLGRARAGADAWTRGFQLRSGPGQEALRVDGGYREGAIGDALLPKPCGMLHRPGRVREVVHSRRGPTCSLTLGQERRSRRSSATGGSTPRRLSFGEVRSFQGGQREAWAELGGEEAQQREGMEAAVRAAGPQTTAKLLDIAADPPQQRQARRSLLRPRRGDGAQGDVGLVAGMTGCSEESGACASRADPLLRGPCGRKKSHKAGQAAPGRAGRAAGCAVRTPPGGGPR